MGNKFTLAALLAFSCIGAAQAADFDDTARSKVIQDYAQKLQDTYVFPAKGKQLADGLRRHLAQGDYAGLNEKQLADKVQQDLDSVAVDQHNGLVYVEFDALGEPPPPSKPVEPVPRPGPDNFGFAKFDMRGKTAYLQVTRFAPVDRYSTEALAKIMTQAAGSDAMIIDLRDGHGGVPGMSTLLSSYFFEDRPVHLLDELDRKGKVTDSFITTSAVSGPRYGSKRPLYILVDEETASAAESFAYALQQHKRAIVVGSKTAGGAHKQFGVPVTHHLIAFVAIGRSVDPVTRANWEGTGIKPDIDVPPSQALDVALAEIAKSGRPINDALPMRRMSDANDIDMSLPRITMDIYRVYPMEELMEQGAIFQSNRSQAIRLPKAVAFPENVKRVDVVVVGRARIITPAGESWESWFDSPAVSADFMTRREQPAEQEREPF